MGEIQFITGVNRKPAKFCHKNIKVVKNFRIYILAVHQILIRQRIPNFPNLFFLTSRMIVHTKTTTTNKLRWFFYCLKNSVKISKCKIRNSLSDPRNIFIINLLAEELVSQEAVHQLRQRIMNFSDFCCLQTEPLFWRKHQNSSKQG